VVEQGLVRVPEPENEEVWVTAAMAVPPTANIVPHRAPAKRRTQRFVFFHPNLLEFA
jgi:hypothetical protein